MMTASSLSYLYHILANCSYASHEVVLCAEPDNHLDKLDSYLALTSELSIDMYQ